MRGKISKALVPQLWNVAVRALLQIGRPIKYHLEYPNGGADPDAKGPEDASVPQADCIAFALWCAAMDRFQNGKGATKEAFPLYDGYINTDSMIAEARTKAKWFRILDAPEPGCFIVAESFFSKLKLRRVIGHIGVVVDTSGWVAGRLSTLGVVHCSPGNYKYTDGKSAIWKTSGSVWAGYPKVYFIKPAWL